MDIFTATERNRMWTDWNKPLHVAATKFIDLIFDISNLFTSFVCRFLMIMASFDFDISAVVDIFLSFLMDFCTNDEFSFTEIHLN